MPKGFTTPGGHVRKVSHFILMRLGIIPPSLPPSLHFNYPAAEGEGEVNAANLHEQKCI